MDLSDRETKAIPIELPGWVPRAALNYLRHTEAGIAIREIARKQGCHASTILRQVRRIERRRDEFLIDEALKDLGRGAAILDVQETADMINSPSCEPSEIPDEATMERESRRVLRRLSEAGAVLAVAREMEKAVVVRELPDGRTIRTGVVDRAVAQAMALKDWIACRSEGRISRYRITQAGRAAMHRLLASDPRAYHGFAEAPAPFADQHRAMDTKDVPAEDCARTRKVRYNAAESPVMALSRRKDRDGKPFLDLDLVAAGERLREDFEMAQMGPRVAQNWERFLTGGERGAFNSAGGGPLSGPDGARGRVMAALKDLGPGLADVVLRCCCFLEGMEVAEKRMGWSARSGKIVLRIALQRLKRHYEDQGQAAMIG